MIPRIISQDMRNRSCTLKNNNVLNRKKKMTTQQIVVLNQSMRLRPISNLITRMASLPEMMSQLKMLILKHLDGVQDYHIDMDGQE